MDTRNSLPKCSISPYRFEGELLILLSGALKMYNSESVKREILALMESGATTLYLHLGGLSELDSAGLGVLMGLHMTARVKKIGMKIMASTNYQLHLFKATRLDTILLFVSETEAKGVCARLEKPENVIPLPENIEN